MIKEHGTLLYRQLADEIDRQIGIGVYRPGDRLPSVRMLRRGRGVSVSTVTLALAELEGRGTIEVRPRSGCFVRGRASAATDGIPAPHRPSVDSRVEELVRATSNHCSFGGAILGSELLPLKQLGSVIRDAVRKHPELLASYGPPSGLLDLQREIAARMLISGVVVAPEEIIITCGGMEALRLALSAVAAPGDVIAVEAPTFFGLLELLRDLDYMIVEVPSEPGSGVRPEAFERVVKNQEVKAFVLQCNFQNPTGSLVSSAAKREIVRIAHRAGVTLIEDDVYGELSYSAQRPKPLMAYGEADIIYCSSFSKVLAPGLRVGWIVPGLHRERVQRFKFSGTVVTPILNQVAVARFLQTGSYERHLRRVREKIRVQVAEARVFLSRNIPGARVTMPEGGYLLWVTLPEQVDTAALYEELKRRGIGILPGAMFSSGGAHSNSFRLCCGSAWTPRRSGALHTLAEVAKAHIRKPLEANCRREETHRAS